MAPKKGEKEAKTTETTPETNPTSINSTTDLKNFLITLQDRMNTDAAPIFAVSTMNYILSLPNIYECLDTETREMMRAVWLKLKASGAILREPPILFPIENQG